MRKKTDSNGKWGREQTVMKNKTVAVREAVTEQETSLFWRELRNYQERDIFPDVGQEDREYFSGQEYYNEIQKLNLTGHMAASAVRIRFRLPWRKRRMPGWARTLSGLR